MRESTEDRVGFRKTFQYNNMQSQFSAGLPLSYNQVSFGPRLAALVKNLCEGKRVAAP